MNRKLLWGCVLVLALLLATAAGEAAFAEGSVYTITGETYSTYFNNDGTTTDEIGDDCPQLVFSGGFSNKSFILDKPVTVTADPEAPPVLTNSTIIITSENVTVDGLTLTADADLGNLIDVQNSNVTVRNMTITYTTDSEGCAVNVGKVMISGDEIIEGGSIGGVVLQNNTIVFETHLEEKDNAALAAAINVENAEDVSVSGNKVTASFPALPVDWFSPYQSLRIGSVRLYDVSGSSFTGNSVTATVSGADGSYPTGDIMILAASDDILIQDNIISATEAAVPADTVLYTYGVDCATSTGLVFDANDFDFSGADENTGYGTFYGFQLVGCTVEMTGNTIRCDANRPVSGIYLSDWNGPTQVSLQDNEITVSGYIASNDAWYSVSCIENSGGTAIVKDSTLRAENKYETYDDELPVAGIFLSGYIYASNGTSLDIQNNDIFTNGHYAVNIGTAINAVTVTGNRLGAAELGGDDPVYYAGQEADDVLIDNNTTVVSPPAFSPAGGLYAETQDVALSCLTQGAVIHYTVNGDEPTAESPVYAEPIRVSEAMTIKAVALMDGQSSTVSSASYHIGSVVTPENFFEYFDDYGALLDSVTAQTLYFEGEFDDSLTSCLVLDRPITLTGSPDAPAVLADMGIIIVSDDVTLDGLTLEAAADLGNLIDIYGSDVTVRNMNITYATSEPGCAVSTGGAVGDIFDEVDSGEYSGVVIEDNIIHFETSMAEIEEGDPAAAVNLAGVEESVLRRNRITASMPAFMDDLYKNEYYVMGISWVAPLRIRSVFDSEITGNTLQVSLNGLDKNCPTLEAMFIGGCSNVLIQGNSVSIADTFTPVGKDVYLYGAECVSNEELVFKDNPINVSTKGGVSGQGMAAGLLGFNSELVLVGNTIRCDANGPSLGVYLPYGWAMPCDLAAEGNIITVSGYAAESNSYAMISGMELETADADISGNTIRVRNKNAENSEDYPVAGISCFGASVSVELDFEDNSVLTNGKYAVNFDDIDDATVTGNRLSTAGRSGDEAVCIGSGSGNTVENNTGYAEPVFSPEGGVYAGTQNVTISSAAKDALIYYTLNGDSPMAESTVYAEPISVSGTTVIRAVTMIEGFGCFSETNALYVIGSEADAFANVDFVLPADLTEVEEEAFAGVSAAAVVIPDTCAAIGAYAFRGCEDLRMIRIPAACTVGEDAFADCELVYIFGYAGSSAESYCEAHDNCVFMALTE